MRKIGYWRSMLPALALLLAPAAAWAGQNAWKLIWADEFTGPAGQPPDPTKWVLEKSGGGQGNNELQVYTSAPENASLDGNGNLILRALRTHETEYTSARLKTEGKFQVRYGKIEARIKVPYSQGLWAAFWMLGVNRKEVGWPHCGEIDIMENIGKEPSTVHGSVHGPGYSGGNPVTAAFTLPSGARFTDEFHVFAVEWSPDVIVFLLDGAEYSRVTPDSLPHGDDWVFGQPFYLILNVAVGGNWPGNPDRTTTFPQEMRVDYVRVWQR